ncbi:MAG: Gfo/Idh/MocA family oxidoreductase [Acetobacteraceae bacterium]|nr:Gfo/Idh/MocA family oxidoreductase [Acetobacteraceae bacterium]
MIRLGLIGGGFVAGLHLGAAALSGAFRPVAAMGSADPARAAAFAAAHGLRAYHNLEAMLAGEAALPDGMQAVALLTPNHLHRAQAIAVLEAGLDLLCEKPLAATLEDARAVRDAARASGCALVLAHGYSGYPMLRQARALVGEGAIGAVRAVQAEYLGGGLAERVEGTPDGARRWRLDPARAGECLVLLDLGTHAHHALGFILGEWPDRVSAELGALVPGRRATDYASLRLGFASGARGTLVASSAAAGQENHFALRIIGERGSLEWRGARLGELWLRPLRGPAQLFTRGMPELAPAARRATRIPRTGHPEGLHEGFATLYADLAERILARREARAPDPLALHSPGAEEGVRGLGFVDAAVRSAAAEGAWCVIPGPG